MNTFPSATIVEIPIEKMIRRGLLEIPPKSKSIIIFVQGHGGGRLSPRNRLVARTLHQRGFAVMLPDLSEPDEDLFDLDAPQDAKSIARGAARLTAIIDWLAKNPKTSKLRIGLFGARAGAAVAMIAAARRPELVRTVISRGGRPDLAADQLEQVLAPTLMIVGAKDSTHIQHNRHACGKMNSRPMLEVVQGADHLFSEPGMIDKVASMATLWFQRNLALYS